MADSKKTVAIGIAALLLILLLSGAGGDPVGPTLPPGPVRPPRRDVPPKDAPLPTLPPGWPGQPGRPPIPPRQVPPRNPGLGELPRPDKPDDPPPPRMPTITPTLGELVSDYPGPARLYPVKYGDTFGGTNGTNSIAYRYLLSAGYLAAKEVGNRPDQEAQQFARSVAQTAGNRSKAIEIIQCCGWNDLLYGTYGWAEGKASPTSTGRAIRLLPQHSDVLSALENLDIPLRNIALGNPSDKGKGNAVGVSAGEGGSFELLWLPGLDLDALWSSGGKTVQVGGEWPDGTSEALPPPWVQALGATVPEAVNVTRYGCGLGAWELE